MQPLRDVISKAWVAEPIWQREENRRVSLGPLPPREQQWMEPTGARVERVELVNPHGHPAQQARVSGVPLRTLGCRPLLFFLKPPCQVLVGLLQQIRLRLQPEEQKKRKKKGKKRNNNF